MSDTIKLTFKDLKNDRFVIEASPSNTIAEVKEKIHGEKGWEASSLKLIYSGKILQDAQTVSSYNIEQTGFIVCMVSKAKAPVAKASGSSSAATPSTPVKSSTPIPTPSAPVQNAPSSSANIAVPETPTPAPQATAAPAGPAAFNDPSSLAMGTARETAIQQMMEMGFDRPNVEAAMRAAFNNPDRAMEYLLNGIPEHLQRENAPAPPPQVPRSQQPAAQSTSPQATADPVGSPTADEPINLFDAAAAQRTQGRGGGAGRGAAAGLAPGGNGNLDFLRNNPQFQQLRQVVQQNPQMLEPILQQVGTGNPQLAQLIGSNPEAFLRLLSEGTEGEDALEAMLGGAAGGAGAGAGGNTMTINVTEEERDAIDRLCQLGFERDLVIQAYFACDKNEEMAANFLFEQPPDQE